MKDSTKLIFKKHGWRVDRAIHNYIYFVFYYPYVKTVEVLLRGLKYLTWFKPLAPLGRMAFNRYHAKVLSGKDIEKILTLNEDVSVLSEENRRAIPFKYAYKIIFQEPEFIAVMDCPCKLATNAPAWSINSCLAVGKDLATFWLEHCEKYNARRISQEEALDLVRKFRDEGYVTQAFFKVATGGGTGVICNCHPDTCVSLIASRHGVKLRPDLSQSVESGYSVIRDAEKCTDCGICESFCHFQAIQWKDGNFLYNRELCMGCELCVEHCPEDALTLYRDPGKSLPLDLDLLRETE
ncbi:MAG: 4Fe-4S binding protein [Deltaproteobacteria bacterium]|nr:4Fe-4S binding protein [Deltaproteobacteria bacterium]